ncbi:MAG TPA: sulfotransferase family 2 domain-containing protein [Pirellulales bacterium]|nr:sulfotransferase family 2 domain-containing protein [Pirellulales bacterium]
MVPRTLWINAAKHVAPRRLRHRLAAKRVWLLQEIASNPETEYSFTEMDRLKCIFFHIPKTGGISVARSLFGSLGVGHITREAAEIVFGARSFRAYFKFCFVRNPWDRLVSCYHYLRAWSDGPYPFVEEWVRPFETFDLFVREALVGGAWMHDQHLWPQHRFVCSNGKLHVDYVGRFETLGSDCDTVARRLGLDVRLAHMNKSQRRDYREYYNDETRDIVADVYREDIGAFGYDFDTWKGQESGN